jgi:uncharacterized protein
LKLKVFIIILLFLALLFFLSGREKNVLEIKIGEESLFVWTAKTTQEKSTGLSGVKKLEETEGMLFIFEEETIPFFWMKDMNFPIDIIWINSKKEVIEITESILPETYPKTFSPKKPVKYVLEVSAKWCEEKNIEIGDKLDL